MGYMWCDIQVGDHACLLHALNLMSTLAQQQAIMILPPIHQTFLHVMSCHVWSNYVSEW
jgi:hypothetical protein